MIDSNGAGAGAITIAGRSAGGNDYEQTQSSRIEAASADVTFNVDTIDLASGSVASAGSLTIQPRTASTTPARGS